MRGMNNKIALVAIFFLTVAASGPTAAQAQAPEVETRQRFAELGNLPARAVGAVDHVIEDFRLGYRTVGKLNAEKSNAVLWPTWLGGKTQDLLKFIGPGQFVDTTR